MQKKDRITSIISVVMLNIIAYNLLNNENNPHISPKFVSWVVGAFTGVLGLWLYLEIMKGVEE